MNLKKIDDLFNSDKRVPEATDYDWDSVNDELENYFHTTRVDAYPLAFLRTAGNIQATGVPACFRDLIKEINGNVKDSQRRSHSYNSNQHDDPDDDAMDCDDDEQDHNRRYPPALRPICSQFYNYITHRSASRAGQHESQQGSVTAAIAGTFAKTPKDRVTAFNKQIFCDARLPSDRFDTQISVDNCPKSCRAELVYYVDVRRLKDRSGMYVTRS
jgi:hypothetical protein